MSWKESVRESIVPIFYVLSALVPGALLGWFGADRWFPATGALAVFVFMLVSPHWSFRWQKKQSHENLSRKFINAFLNGLVAIVWTLMFCGSAVTFGILSEGLLPGLSVSLLWLPIVFLLWTVEIQIRRLRAKKRNVA